MDIRDESRLNIGEWEINVCNRCTPLSPAWGIGHFVSIYMCYRASSYTYISCTEYRMLPCNRVDSYSDCIYEYMQGEFLKHARKGKLDILFPYNLHDRFNEAINNAINKQIIYIGDSTAY